MAAASRAWGELQPRAPAAQGPGRALPTHPLPEAPLCPAAHGATALLSSAAPVPLCPAVSNFCCPCVRALSCPPQWSCPSAAVRPYFSLSSPLPRPAAGRVLCGTWRRAAGQQDRGASASGGGWGARRAGGHQHTRPGRKGTRASRGRWPQRQGPGCSGAVPSGVLSDSPALPRGSGTEATAPPHTGLCWRTGWHGTERGWGRSHSQVGAGRLGWIRAGVGAAREQGGGQREGRVQAEGVVAPLWPRPPQPRSQRAPALARSPRCLAPSSCLPPAHSADSMRRQTKSLLERVAASIRFEERIDPRGPWARPAAPPGIRLGLAPRGQPIAVQTLDVVSSSFITASPLMFEKQGSFVFYIEYFHHA